MLSKEYIKKNLGEFLFRTLETLYAPHGPPLKVLVAYGKKGSNLTKIIYDPNEHDKNIFIYSIPFEISSFERKYSYLLKLAKKYEKDIPSAQKSIEEIVLDEIELMIDKRKNYKKIQELLKQHSNLYWDLEFIGERMRTKGLEKLFNSIPK